MDKSAVEKTQMKNKGTNERSNERMIEWLIDKARKKNQIKWHRIGKDRLFASFGST